MTIYIGFDFQARSQTVAWLDTSNGEIQTRTLHHQQDDVRSFYTQFAVEVTIGIEASGDRTWFEELLLLNRSLTAANCMLRGRRSNPIGSFTVCWEFDE